MSDEKNTSSWGPCGGEDKVLRPIMAERQARGLIMLKGVLEEALKVKQADLERAQMALARLKHGGGV